MAEDRQHSYWHVGDLLWGMYQNTIYDPRKYVRLWENKDGELLAFAWVNAVEVILQVSPRYHGSELYKLLLQQMFAWGEERQRAALEGHFKRVPSFCAFEDDYSLIDFFKQHGFEGSEFYIQHMSRDLHLPSLEVVLPEGYTVRQRVKMSLWSAWQFTAMCGIPLKSHLKPIDV